MTSSTTAPLLIATLATALSSACVAPIEVSGGPARATHVLAPGALGPGLRALVHDEPVAVVHRGDGAERAVAALALALDVGHPVRCVEPREGVGDADPGLLLVLGHVLSLTACTTLATASSTGTPFSWVPSR